MPDEYDETLDSQNEETDQEDNLETTEDESTPAEDSDDVDALKEKNRQLFARAKKAEGFVLREGKWVKPPKAAPKLEAKPEVKEDKPDVAATVNEVLDQRDLEALDVSDSLKKETKDYAKLKGISVKAAFNSAYIQFQKEQEDKEKKVEDASLGGKGKGSSKKDYSQMTASDFDMTTPTGKEDFAKWEEYTRKQLG